MAQGLNVLLSVTAVRSLQLCCAKFETSHLMYLSDFIYSFAPFEGGV